MSSEPVQLWNSEEAVDRWRRGAARRQQAVAAATERMLDAVGLEPGFRVLDIAAGTGDTTFMVAQRVGPTGAVLAVDISTAMIQTLNATAREESMTNVETLIADATYLDLPPHTYDAAISRFGLMFLSDIVQGLRRIRTVLKPGRRLAGLIWSTLERNPYMRIPTTLADELGQQSAATEATRRAVP